MGFRASGSLFVSETVHEWRGNAQQCAHKRVPSRKGWYRGRQRDRTVCGSNEGGSGLGSLES